MVWSNGASTNQRIGMKHFPIAGHLAFLRLIGFSRCHRRAQRLGEKRNLGGAVQFGYKTWLALVVCCRDTVQATQTWPKQNLQRDIGEAQSHWHNLEA